YSNLVGLFDDEQGFGSATGNWVDVMAGVHVALSYDALERGLNLRIRQHCFGTGQVGSSHLAARGRGGSVGGRFFHIGLSGSQRGTRRLNSGLGLLLGSV